MKTASYKCIENVENYFHKGKTYTFNKEEGHVYLVCDEDESGFSHKTTKDFMEKHFVLVSNNIPKPYCNPYSLAKKAYDDTQITQIQKGMQKYGTPLHPSNHSSEELFNHAFEELVDLTHYIAAYHYKMHHIKERLSKGLATGDPDRLAIAVQEALDMIGDTV